MTILSGWTRLFLPNNKIARILNTRPRLSWHELGGLLARLVLLAPVLVSFNVTRGLIFALRRKLSLWEFAECSAIRTLVELLSPRQVQFILPSTGEVYLLWLSKTVSQGKIMKDNLASRLFCDVEALPDGKSSILWLGDRRKATKFVLFLHGGGYILPLDLGHLGWCMNAYIRGGAEIGENVAVAILQYSLCPEAAYPTQLQQAADALISLLERGIAPSDIVFGGDSCGGHMTASLLGHLVHPHPHVKEIIVGAPFAATFLVSPWLSTTDTGVAFQDNAQLDLVSSQIVRQSSKLTFRGHVAAAEVERGQGWALPLSVEASWFRGLGSKVRQVLVTVGAVEVLQDEGIQFAHKVEKANPGMEVRLQIRPEEAHDFVLLEGEWNMLGNGTKDMKTWYQGVLVSGRR